MDNGLHYTTKDYSISPELKVFSTVLCNWDQCRRGGNPREKVNLVNQVSNVRFMQTQTSAKYNLNHSNIFPLQDASIAILIGADKWKSVIGTQDSLLRSNE